MPGDTHNDLLWDERASQYVGFSRGWKGVRQVVRSESADLKSWTPARVVLQGVRGHETYAIQVFPCGGLFLGLLMVIDTTADTVQCELAASVDTIAWERVCPGEPLIGNGPQGSYDFGCVYASPPIVQGNRILLYYGGSDALHFDCATRFSAGRNCPSIVGPATRRGQKTRTPATSYAAIGFRRRLARERQFAARCAAPYRCSPQTIPSWQNRSRFTAIPPLLRCGGHPARIPLGSSARPCGYGSI